MEYVNIGRISSTHGLDGTLLIIHNLGSKQAFQKIPHIFIELRRESYIPYFIEEKRIIADDEVLLRLDDVTAVEIAKTLTGKNIYIEEERYEKLKPKGVTVNMVGFTVTDKSAGVLGVVETLFETPGQVLATIQHKGKEVIIPLIDSTIVGIDANRRTITVNLPDGLLDVYLDS
jgi:16S rRNA processing protein RimM